jgi:hypothetical protein
MLVSINNLSRVVHTEAAVSAIVTAMEESEALLDLPAVTSEPVESMPEVRVMGENPDSSSRATSLKSESVATESRVDIRKV